MSSRPARGAARLAAILDALPDALLLVNGNGTVVKANAIAGETLEAPGAPLVGRGLLDIIPAFDPRRIPGSMRRPDEDPGVRTRPTRMIARRTDGAELPVEVTSALLQAGQTPYVSAIDAAFGDDHASEELLMLVVRDLSGTLDTEAELARQQRQTEMILRAASEGVVGVDTAGRVVLVNPAAAQLLGHRAGKLGGQELHPLVHHSRPDGSPLPFEETPLHDTLVSGRKHRVRMGQVLWTKDGRAVPVDMTTAPVREGDQLVGAVMTFTDRRPQDAMNSRYEQLLAVLGHSLHGPLEELRGELTALAADPAGQLWPEANQILHHLAAGYARMATLVDNVLGYQRLDAGKEQLARKKVALDEVINAGVDGATELIGPGRAQFAVHAPPTEAEVDPERLAQALAHLIADVAGVDATGRSVNTGNGGPSDSTIVVAAAQRGDVVRIEVRGPFPGGDPVHGPLVSGIVRMHGGVLQTHEVPGASGGTAYVLEVPVSADAAPAPGPAPGPAPRPRDAAGETTVMPVPVQPARGTGGPGGTARGMATGNDSGHVVAAPPASPGRPMPRPRRPEGGDFPGSRQGPGPGRGQGGPVPGGEHPAGGPGGQPALPAPRREPGAPVPLPVAGPQPVPQHVPHQPPHRARRPGPAQGASQPAPPMEMPILPQQQAPRQQVPRPPTAPDGPGAVEGAATPTGRRRRAPAEGDTGTPPDGVPVGPENGPGGGRRRRASAPADEEVAENGEQSEQAGETPTGRRRRAAEVAAAAAAGQQGPREPIALGGPEPEPAADPAPDGAAEGPAAPTGPTGPAPDAAPEPADDAPAGAGDEPEGPPPVEHTVVAASPILSGSLPREEVRRPQPALPMPGAERAGRPDGRPGVNVRTLGQGIPVAQVNQLVEQRAEERSAPGAPADPAHPAHPAHPNDPNGPTGPNGQSGPDGQGGRNGPVAGQSIATPVIGPAQSSAPGRRRKLAAPPTDNGRAEGPGPAGPGGPTRPGPTGPAPVPPGPTPGGPQRRPITPPNRTGGPAESGGRQFAIGAPAAGAEEGPEPLDGPNGAIEVTDSRGMPAPMPMPTDEELPPEPLDNPRRLLVWPEPDVSTQQALTDRGYRPVLVQSREEVDAQIAAYPAALFVDPLTGPITRTALQSLRQAAVAAEVPVLVTAGLGQAGREAAYGADPAVLLKALAPRDSEQHPPRVLLVEESAEIATALTASLERRGMQVEHAATDASAVESASRVRPNLVVMDLHRMRRGRAGIVDWLRVNGLLNRTPFVVYTTEGLDPAGLPLLASGEAVLFLAERSTSDEVQERIVDLLARIGAQ
ncbi:hybrid sensor histidine kinase/response regulator [Streptomyces sp. ST2-7A]|uniref:hybrid sensor histidine kinase/response regulator n=1 Tax=Streptomyces sp. ST2-7A TaxID=2907214 RepID=UPI001F26EAD9|nr:hybrid sensor histidine kinase/response regulator [Streptomyces sp. ST2-7A]MCE7080456.1 PAS domain-containing protein [Streptomyces sp. ST2-7A]